MTAQLFGLSQLSRGPLFTPGRGKSRVSQRQDHKREIGSQQPGALPWPLTLWPLDVGLMPQAWWSLCGPMGSAGQGSPPGLGSPRTDTDVPGRVGLTQGPSASLP